MHYPQDKYEYDAALKEKGEHPYRILPPDWRENEIFHATIEFVDFDRGRSSVVVNFRDCFTDAKLHMFLTDFASLVPKLENGRYVGNFTYCKRGQNYAVMPLLEEA